MRVEYPQVAWEVAMKRQEVILKAMSGELSWIQAAHILRMSQRNLRRLRRKYESWGYDGLLDRRTGRPSPKRAPFNEVQQVLRLYRERYQGFNVRHFHETIQREEGVVLSYTFVRKVLQECGLVKKSKGRGPHRRRRERKACFGEMLHVDGSDHAWLSLEPDEKQALIVIVDDATSRVLYAQLWEAETSQSILQGFYEVVKEHGIPMSVYNDRAGWAFHTPKAGGPVDKENLTEVGRVFAHLGIEHIPSYSPQARGRSERLNRTFQGRLINELRLLEIRTIEAANRYLREVFLPRHNEQFTRPPVSPSDVFVSAGNADLRQIFCFAETRKVAKDNTVSYHNVRLQIEKQPGRISCVGLKVLVRKHLDGMYSIWHGVRCMGAYDAQGELLTPARSRKAQSSPDLAALNDGGRARRLPQGAPDSPSSSHREVSVTGQITC